MRSRSTQNKFSTAKRLKILCASESFGGFQRGIRNVSLSFVFSLFLPTKVATKTSWSFRSRVERFEPRQPLACSFRLIYSIFLWLALANRHQYQANYHKNFYARGATQFSPACFIQRQGKMVKECERIAKHFNAVFEKKRRWKPVVVQTFLPPTQSKGF